MQIKIPYILCTFVRLEFYFLFDFSIDTVDILRKEEEMAGKTWSLSCASFSTLDRSHNNPSKIETPIAWKSLRKSM
jgi:hypothetical protein